MPTSKRTTKKPSPKKTSTRSAPVRPKAVAKPAPRADYGAPIDGYFRKQPAALQPVHAALRKLVEEAVPEASSSIKWGMPVFTLDGEIMVALRGRSTYVTLILSGPPTTFDDPDGRLEGEGTTGRHLKVPSLDALPRAAVKKWIQTAAKNARAKKR
jgi:hypothetical protein